MNIRTLMVAMIAIIPAGFVMAQETQATQNSPAPALTVSAMLPVQENWKVTLQASGWLAAWQESVISAEISGQRITSMNVDVGNVVQKGDVLAELSNQTIRNDISQQTAVVESAQAAFDQAEGDGDRARGLSSSGAITEQQVTSYLVSERRAKADLASAEAALASSRLELERSRIIAIDDGVISSRNAALGDVVSAGSELFRLIRQNRIEWQAEVPQRRLRALLPGVKAIIPTPIGDVSGVIRLVAPTTSDSNGRVKVYVSLEQPEGFPAPPTGVLVSGFFQLGESVALTVPATALTLRDGFSYVFYLKGTEPETVGRLRVETGRRQDDRVEITDGLDADAMVVSAGGAFLAEGAVVRVVTGAPEVSE